MKTAKVLDFPYSRIRTDTESHTAKIIPLPRPGYPSGDILALPMVVAAAWLEMWGL